MSNIVLLVSIFSNIFLTIVKILAGYFCNCKSLIADGMHSFSDLSTDIIAVLGNKLSKKPADSDHPYGHGRVNYITSVLIGAFIVLVGFNLFKNSFSYSYTEIRKVTILVVIVTIVIKFLVSRLLIVTGKRENNNILIASGKESFSDVFSSILVLFMLILGLFSDRVELFKYADMAGSVIISSIIMIVGIRILLENFSSLLGQVEVSFHKVNKVKSFLINNYNIRIKDILLIKYGTYYQAFIDIEVSNKIKVKELDDLINSIKDSLLKEKFNIKYVHVDFNIERSDRRARITRGRNSKRSIKKKSIG